jgi:hypothetical protein
VNLEVIKNAVTSKAGRQILLTKKHSPTIMFVGGVVGVAGTVVLACRATLKVEEVLDDSDKKRLQIKHMVHPEYSERDRKKDGLYLSIQTMAKITRLYAPAAGLGVISVAALTGSHVVLTRRNVAVTAAYKAVEEGFAQYRERVAANLGEEKEREIYRGVGTVDIHDTKAGKVEAKKFINPGGGPPSMYAKFFDHNNKNWSPLPEYNMLFLRANQNYANQRLHARGHVLLNDIYDELGMERTKAGCVVGWVLGNGDDYIDFGVFDTNANDSFYDFVHGDEGIWLDFNVDGVVYELI